MNFTDEEILRQKASRVDELETHVQDLEAQIHNLEAVGLTAALEADKRATRYKTALQALFVIFNGRTEVTTTRFNHALWNETPHPLGDIGDNIAKALGL